MVAATRAVVAVNDSLRSVFETAPIGTALVRLDDNRIVAANPALAELLEIDQRLLVGCTLREFTHPEDAELIVEPRAQLELGQIDSFDSELRLRRLGGDDVWARIRIAIADPEHRLAVVHVVDLSEQRRVEVQLRASAWHDPLTGLPNHTYLLQLLDDRLHESNDVSLLLIDVDGFGSVNEGGGHQLGDEVLRAVAARLRAPLEADEILARLGGDEFAVVSRRGGELAAELQRAVREPLPVAGHDFTLTISIGGSGPANGRNASELLRDAVTGLGQAQQGGPDRTVELTPDAAHPTPVAMVEELRIGIEHEQMVPYYQPIVSLDDGRTLGLDVVARWLHPERGLVLPERFVEQASRVGLIAPITIAVAGAAIHQFARWRHDRRVADLDRLTVRVPFRQLVTPAFGRWFRRQVTEVDVEADRIWIAVDEREFDGSDITRAIHALGGARLLIDRWGLGRMPLRPLTRLPVGVLRCDRSLTVGLTSESADEHTVRFLAATAEFARVLGVDVQAVGIESDEQAERLRTLGVTVGQGYLYGRPRPAHLIER